MTPDSPLQFDRVARPDAAVEPSTPACERCKKPVGGSYFSVGKAIFCGKCKTLIEQAGPSRATRGLVARATLFGIGGAIVGAAVYYAVLAATGYEIGLVAIAVGFLVGRAVQLGARGARGRAFQIVALTLTYVGIAAGYAPEAFKGLSKHKHAVAHADTARVDSTTSDSAGADSARADNAGAGTDGAPHPHVVVKEGGSTAAGIGGFLAGLGVIFARVLAIPVLAVFGGLPASLITGIIIAVGLRQAWIMNRAYPRPVFHGPYKVGDGSRRDSGPSRAPAAPVPDAPAS